MGKSRIVVDEKLFEKLLDSAPDPIVIVDEDGNIVVANLEAERKFGYTRAELIDQPIEILVPLRFRHRHVGQRQGFEQEPHARPMGASLDLSARRKDGSEFPVEISLSPLNTPQGRLVVSIVRDITDRKQAERELKAKAEELARSNGELEQFAYIASHDLQEPLRAIAGACQFLARRYKDRLDDEAREFIGFAVDGAKRMQELISDLLDYSRVTSKARELVATSAEATVSSVTANLSLQIDEKAARVTHGPLPEVNADPSQLLQLLQNLVTNALKFNDKAAPRVHVSSVLEGGLWHFTVQDNGIGIDPKYFDRLFVIFKRLHGRGEYPGTGLGLALCKKIVERHGGRIWVDSTPGEGSTFHFTLPT